MENCGLIIAQQINHHIDEKKETKKERKVIAIKKERLIIIATIANTIDIYNINKLWLLQ